VHLDFVERVDRLDQLLVDAVAPQQRNVVHCGAQRLFRDDLLQQLIEGETGELFAAEDVVQCQRPLATDLQVLVEQEQTFVHRAQNVRRFLALPMRDCFFLAHVAREVEEDRAEQQYGGDDAEHLHGT